MCPEAYKLSQQVEIITTRVNDASSLTSETLKQDANRTFIRFSSNGFVDPATVTGNVQIQTMDNGIAIVVGVITPYFPTVELSFAQHGPLVWRRFFTVTTGGSGFDTIGIVIGRIIGEVK